MDYNRYSPMPPTSIGGLSPDVQDELLNNADAIARRERIRQALAARDAAMMQKATFQGQRQQAPVYLNPTGQSAGIARQRFLEDRGLLRSPAAVPGFGPPGSGMSAEKQDSNVIPYAQRQVRAQRILSSIDPDRYGAPSTQDVLAGGEVPATPPFSYTPPENPQQSAMDAVFGKSQADLEGTRLATEFAPAAEAASGLAGPVRSLEASIPPTADMLPGSTPTPVSALNTPSQTAADPRRLPFAGMPVPPYNGPLAGARNMAMSLSPEDRAKYLPEGWRTSGEAAPNPRVDQMILAAQAQKRAELLSQNPALRSPSVLPAQTAREKLLDAIPESDSLRAAMLRQNPQLADRIAAERQLTRAMQPMETATANTSPERARQILEARGILKNNELRAKPQSSEPVPIDQSLFQAALARRQAERAKRQELVSAIARGNRGYVTPETAMMMQASRNPQLAALMQQGGLKQMEILAELQKARMGVDAEMARSNNYSQLQRDLNTATNASNERQAGMKFTLAPGQLSDVQQAGLQSELRAIEQSGLSDQDKAAKRQSTIQRYITPSPQIPNTPSTPNSTAPVAPPQTSMLPVLPDDLEGAMTALSSLPENQLTDDMLAEAVRAKPQLLTAAALQSQRQSTFPQEAANTIFRSYYPESHGPHNYLSRILWGNGEPVSATQARYRRRAIIDKMLRYHGVDSSKLPGYGDKAPAS